MHFTNKLSQILQIDKLLLGSVIIISGSYINSFKHWSSNFQWYPLAHWKDKKMSKSTVCVGCSKWLIESPFQPGIIFSLSKKSQKERTENMLLLCLCLGPPLYHCLHLLSLRETIQKTTKHKVICDYFSFMGFKQGNMQKNSCTIIHWEENRA